MNEGLNAVTTLDLPDAIERAILIDRDLGLQVAMEPREALPSFMHRAFIRGDGARTCRFCIRLGSRRRGEKVLE